MCHGILVDVLTILTYSFFFILCNLALKFLISQTFHQNLLYSKKKNSDFCIISECLVSSVMYYFIFFYLYKIK